MASCYFVVGISVLVLSATANSDGRRGTVHRQLDTSPSQKVGRTRTIRVDATGEISQDVSSTLSDLKGTYDYSYYSGDANYYSYDYEGLGTSEGTAGTSPSNGTRPNGFTGCKALKITGGSVGASCNAGKATLLEFRSSTSIANGKYADYYFYDEGLGSEAAATSTDTAVASNGSSDASKCTVSAEHAKKGWESMKEMYPEHADTMDKHCLDIHKVVAGEKPSAALMAVKGKPPSATNKSDNSSRSSLLELTPCEEAVGIFLLSIGADIVSFAGLKVRMSEVSARKELVENIGDIVGDIPAYTQIEGPLKVLQSAANTTARAEALWSLVSNIGGTFLSILKEVVKIGIGQMSGWAWWEWTTTGLQVLATLAAWVLSDGALLIAEIVAGIATIVSSLNSLNDLITTCSK